MTRTISNNLKDHYAGHVRTVARCWQIVRTDSTEYTFTDHDEDLVIATDTYKSLNAGSMSAVDAKDNLAIDTLEIEMILNSSDIDGDDIKGGLFDNAQVWIFEVDYTTIADGTVTLAYGYIGEVELHDNYAKAEFRSLAQQLQKNIGRTYTNDCDAALGDSRCGLDLDSLGYKQNGTVTTVVDRANFNTDDTGGSIYENGRFIWTSGDNNGLTMEIKSYLSDVVKLVLPMPFNIQVGDVYKAYQGCPKTLTACRDTYDNVVNYRGFPHLPGLHDMLQYPDAK